MSWGSSDGNDKKSFRKADVVRFAIYGLVIIVFALLCRHFFIKGKGAGAEVKVVPIANRTHVCIYDNKRSKLMSDFIAVGKVQPKDGAIYFEEDITKNMIGISGALIVTTNAIECPILNEEEYP